VGSHVRRDMRVDQACRHLHRCRDPRHLRDQPPGGKFETLLKNLRFIATLRASGPLEWLGINIVVQANIFAEMPDSVRLGRRFGVDTVYFHQLVN
jgi:hypothetical protein